MTWVKLDDGFFRNSKSRAAGKEGRELYIAGLCYCAGSLTDGFIPTRDIGLVAAEAQVRPKVAETLVMVGLWSKVDGGWRIPDYLHFNPSGEKVRRERAEGRKRAAASAARRGEASGEATGAAKGAASGDPSSSRPSGVDVSRSSSSVVPAGEDDDDWATLEARRRLSVRRGDPVPYPEAWVRKVAANLRLEHPNGLPKPALTLVREPCGNPECSNGFVLDDQGDAVECSSCRAAS